MHAVMHDRRRFITIGLAVAMGIVASVVVFYDNIVWAVKDDPGVPETAPYSRYHESLSSNFGLWWTAYALIPVALVVIGGLIRRPDELRLALWGVAVLAAFTPAFVGPALSKAPDDPFKPAGPQAALPGQTCAAYGEEWTLCLTLTGRQVPPETVADALNRADVRPTDNVTSIAVDGVQVSHSQWGR
jgi:hypothetical protein